MNVLDYIPKGKENAVTSMELMNILKCSMRELRFMIANARNRGEVICSFSGGYYLPETKEELKESINFLQGKANSIYYVLRSQRKALEEMDGQEVLEVLNE